MKAKDLFLHLSREELEKQGFAYRYNMFYRLNGTILQGIALDSLQYHYYIRYTQFPYWCYRLIFKDTPVKKRYWVISGECKLSREFLPNTPTENENAMRSAFELFKEDILPTMNKTFNEQTFLNAPRRYFSQETAKPYALMSISCEDGNWNYAKQWLDLRLKEDEISVNKRLGRYPQEPQDLFRGPPLGWRGNSPETEEEIEEEVRAYFSGFFQRQYGKITDIIEQGSIDEIRLLYTSERDVMRKLLWDDLKISI